MDSQSINTPTEAAENLDKHADLVAGADEEEKLSESFKLRSTIASKATPENIENTTNSKYSTKTRNHISNNFEVQPYSPDPIKLTDTLNHTFAFESIGEDNYTIHDFQINENKRPSPIKTSLKTTSILEIDPEGYRNGSIFAKTPKKTDDLNPQSKGVIRRNTLLKFKNIFSSNPEDRVVSKVFELINDKAMPVEGDHEEVTTIKRKRKDQPMRLKQILQKHANAKKKNRPMEFVSLLTDIQRIKKGRFGRLRYRLLKLKRNLFFYSSETLQVKLKQTLAPMRPHTLFSFIWDAMTIVLIIVDLVLIPYFLSFGLQGVFENFEYIQLLFFIMDIALNFNKVYVYEGDLVTNRRMIAKKYLKGWFIIDLLVTFPYQNIPGAPEKTITGAKKDYYDKISKYSKFVRIIRLLRVVKLKKIVKNWEEYIGNSLFVNGIINLLNLSMTILFLAHWCACIWYSIGSSETKYSWLQDSNLSNESVADQYVASLYFAITTMLTVGYGDILPVNLEERIFTIFVMFLGGGVFGYALNSIANILQSLEDDKSKLRKRIYATAQYVKHQGVDKELQSEVKRYLDFMLIREDLNRTSEKAMLELLPAHLLNRINQQMNRKFVSENKILQDTFSEKVTHMIATKVQTRVCSPGEVIYGSDDTDFSIFYIFKGAVGLYFPKSATMLTSLKTSNHFGEKSFFSNLPRTIVSRSIDFCQLLFFKRDDLLEILKDFPFDGEVFHMKKDNIANYEKYSVLGSLCHICNESDHMEDTCPRILYRPDKYPVIKQHLDTERDFAKDFQRKRRNRFNALLNVEKLSGSAEKLFGLSMNHSGTYEDYRDIESPLSMHMQVPKLNGISNPNILRIPYMPLYIAPNNSIPEERESMPSVTTIEYLSPGRKRKITVRTTGKLDGGTMDRFPVSGSSPLFNLNPQGGTYQIIEERMDGSEPEDESTLEFDRARNYQLYFPHNNLSKLIETKQHKVLQKRLSDIEILKEHLARFFQAVE